MNLLPTTLAATLLAFAVPYPGQDAAGRAGAPADRPPELQQLLGAWKLTSFETRTLRETRRDQVGYLLVTDGFLSLEVHIGWWTDTGQRSASTFFTGTHTYTMRSDGVLELSQLIGSTMDPNGTTPVFEPVGRKREYKARFVGAKLTLTREQDQQTFTFERVERSETQLDFFGRRRSPDDSKKGGDER